MSQRMDGQDQEREINNGTETTSELVKRIMKHKRDEIKHLTPFNETLGRADGELRNDIDSSEDEETTIPNPGHEPLPSVNRHTTNTSNLCNDKDNDSTILPEPDPSVPSPAPPAQFQHSHTPPHSEESVSLTQQQVEEEVDFDTTNTPTYIPPIDIWCPPVNGFGSGSVRGFYNIGNTCFMNAALQNMVGIGPVVAYFMGDCFPVGTEETRGRRVVRAFRWLLEEIYGAGDPESTSSSSTQVNLAPIVPSRILYSIRSSHPIFRGFQQHDSQEFLRLFIDSLAEETRLPHFTLEYPPPPDPAPSEASESGDGSDREPGDDDMETDTESYATCDSGNGSEEALGTNLTSTNGQGGFQLLKPPPDPKLPQPQVKITLRSFLADVFDGSMESSVECLSCYETSRRLEIFQDLSLPIPTREELLTIHSTADKYAHSSSGGSGALELARTGLGVDVYGASGWLQWFLNLFNSGWWYWSGPGPSLQDCFSAFFSSDELKGENMYSCAKCGKLRNGLKRSTLHHLPEILTIHLKRFRMFEFGPAAALGGYSSKITTHVAFPLDGLDLEQWLHPDSPSKHKTSTYRLIGTISHIGSVVGGHYTAFIRKESLDSDEDSWFLVDDSRVVPVEPEIVQNSEAYVLFYQKSGGSAAEGPEVDETEDSSSEYSDDDEEERIRPRREKEPSVKTLILREWIRLTKADTAEPDENEPHSSREQGRPKGLLTADRHLISRKWLTRLVWTQDPEALGPLDNSDVVCPHGYRVPLPDDELGLLATWVPGPIWDLIMEKFGGGPDQTTPGDCLTCTIAWKKYLRQQANAANTPNVSTSGGGSNSRRNSSRHHSFNEPNYSGASSPSPAPTASSPAPGSEYGSGDSTLTSELD